MRSKSIEHALIGGLVAVAIVIPVMMFALPQDREVVEAPAVVDATRSAEPREPILPVPRPDGFDPGKVALGKRLFHDPGLSADGSVSCASCHDLSSGGDDGRAQGKGISGKPLTHNTPTVFNSSLNYRQLWDGSVRNLTEQVDGPLLHPDEMGSSWEHVLAVLAADSGYAASFVELYGKIDRGAVRDAIATFESTLLTPDSPFDRWLRGDDDAISARALEGYALFKKLGCASCHQGVNVGGNMMQILGVMDPEVNPKDADLLRVPPLRNVTETAPYFHDGSIETLEEAVRVMAMRQLGHELEKDKVEAIVAFLETLTGEKP